MSGNRSGSYNVKRIRRALRNLKDLVVPFVFSQDLSFQQIKSWNNSDYFAETIFENYWSISESSKFFVKATHSELGEIFYYKEDTPSNVANTFEVKGSITSMHNFKYMLYTIYSVHFTTLF